MSGWMLTHRPLLAPNRMRPPGHPTSRLLLQPLVHPTSQRTLPVRPTSQEEQPPAAEQLATLGLPKESDGTDGPMGLMPSRVQLLLAPRQQ